ncbi:hypothetical protein SAMN04489760_1416 [Syntrophus gentianae]|uniref:Uncharacterized protein n=2 Tax=Syntrophus gentianae TaxID=43775 RepID=A0A1H8AWN9_9BACT|nr:hypothetical protein SAMN04489760_1416 [Syntrophus gentianae]
MMERYPYFKQKGMEPMQTTSFMCPHCKKEHGVREASLWAADSDQVQIRTEIEEADFYDTESLNMQPQIKAELEEEYGRSVDFVLGQYSGWCLRSKEE